MDTRIVVNGNLAGLVGTSFEDAMTSAVAYLEIDPKSRVVCQQGHRSENVTYSGKGSTGGGRKESVSRINRDSFSVQGATTGRFTSPSKSNTPKSAGPVRKAKLERKSH